MGRLVRSGWNRVWGPVLEMEPTKLADVLAANGEEKK